MGKINKVWHDAHKMPQNPTQNERIVWHLEHQKYCHCRPIPLKLAQLINQKK